MNILQIQVILTWLQISMTSSSISLASLVPPHKPPGILNQILQKIAFFSQILFRGGATFEMIGLNTEKSIFRLIKIVAAQRLINGRR